MFKGHLIIYNPIFTVHFPACSDGKAGPWTWRRRVEGQARIPGWSLTPRPAVAPRDQLEG